MLVVKRGGRKAAPAAQSKDLAPRSCLLKSRAEAGAQGLTGTCCGPPAWRLLRTIRLDDETALPLGWQWNPRLINRSCDQRFHVGMCQLAGRLHLDEANLLSRSPQKTLRVGQLRSLTEVKRYTGGRCVDRH